jgi:outer membrane protein OmpA-like peptidoglycan-associated protein
MKVFRTVSALLFALVIVAVPIVSAGTDCGEGDSITITINRRTMPQSLLHPGRFFTKSETLTVSDFVIRDYSGVPIDSFIIQTSSGRTEVPVHLIKEIRQTGWIHRRTEDIRYVENVVETEMLLTDGTAMSGLMNADFGTIEGKTELGEFFLNDPHTVRHLVFNRPQPSVAAPAAPVVPPKEVKVAKTAAPLDSDGDGVPDNRDKCPGTPTGVKVDENGCPPDGDGDGVPDYKDECPHTPKGAPVNSVGCWVIKGIKFDYNKWDIKPEYHGVMDEHVRVLEMNPTFKIEIQGHTDSVASEQYNQALSEKRSESAKAYFVSKKVAADRISTRGFGELEPIATNETPDGRAQNRRIEIKITGR